MTSSPLRPLRIPLASIALAVSALAQNGPPVAPVRDVVDTYFGVSVHDSYRYMEDLKNPEVAKWIKGQADYTRKTLDRIPGRAALLKQIAELGDAAPARVAGVQFNNGSYYYLKRLSSENIPRLYVRVGLNGKERLLVDPEATTTKAGEHYAIDYFSPSYDNRYLAYGISPGGSEESVLHVIEVATGKETGDVIDRAQFGPPAWDDSNRLIYNRLPKLAPDAPKSDKYLKSRAYVHVLGTDPEKDRAILGPGVSADFVTDPLAVPFVSTAPGSPFVIGIVGNGNQREFNLYVARAAAIVDGVPAWQRVASLDDEVTDAALIGRTLYLMTHKNAPHFKVVRLDLSKPDLAKPDLASATVVVPASDAVITGIAAASDALYVRRMTGGISDLVRVEHAHGAKPAPVKLPFDGDIDALAADPRLPGVVFETGAWTRFGGYYAYDPKAAKVVDAKLQPQGPYDNPTDLVSLEVKVKSHDGTMVPLSIVHKKGMKLDGTNPTILYGYGAYGISQTPFFRPQYLAWFEHGGVFAVAHVRGGGENGEEWYKGGYQQTKPNTWRDAIACAEWLVAQRYTSPAKLAIEGGSQGGIYVGRSITERPDLFGAAIDEVPVSDAIRSSFETNGELDKTEMGTTETESGFRALYAMSPYHHIADGKKYPAVLVVTGFNDPRVDAWQAAKMAARLQAATTSGKPVLLRVDFDAGHGYGSTKKQRNEELADTFAFLLWQLGVKGYAR
ncbi:MAG TPA: prolyl oligopeptidase family serine peptidase [Casimicrobiaceae bacterium]|nr:prolyl oligopeptidase family serine peptidase [Casimicrobiaceae bacterium]